MEAPTEHTPTPPAHIYVVPPSHICSRMDGRESAPSSPFFPAGNFYLYTHILVVSVAPLRRRRGERILSTGRKEGNRKTERLVGRWIASLGEGEKWMMVFLSSQT